MRRTIILLVLVVALASATACGSEPESELPQVGPVTLTGDERAADPCALLDPRAFVGGERPTPRPFGDTVGSCRREGYAAGTREQTIAAWFDHERSTTITSAGPPQQLGAVTVLRPVPAADSCRRVVRLPDGALVVLAGWSVSGTTRVGDCQLADRALEFGLQHLAAGGVRYRPDWQAGTAVADADACAVLGDPSTALGLPNPPVYAGFGGWRCFVGTPAPEQPVARTEFLLFDDAADLEAYGQEVAVGAVRARLWGTPGQYTQGCEVLLPWGSTAGHYPGQTVVVRISYEAPTPPPRGSAPDPRCVRAQTLAAGVASRLPSPSV